MNLYEVFQDNDLFVSGKQKSDAVHSAYLIARRAPQSRVTVRSIATKEIILVLNPMS